MQIKTNPVSPLAIIRNITNDHIDLAIKTSLEGFKPPPPVPPENIQYALRDLDRVQSYR